MCIPCDIEYYVKAFSNIFILIGAPHFYGYIPHYIMCPPFPTRIRNHPELAFGDDAELRQRQMPGLLVTRMMRQRQMPGCCGSGSNQQSRHLPLLQLRVISKSKLGVVSSPGKDRGSTNIVGDILIEVRDTYESMFLLKTPLHNIQYNRECTFISLYIYI